MSSESDLEDAMAIAIIAKVALKIGKKKRKKRSCWVRPWIARRELPGTSCLTLVHDELVNEDLWSYQNYLRMDEQSFQKLLDLVDPIIRKKDTNMRPAITSKHRLTVTLRFLATGETYTSMSFSTRIPECTISLFVPEVCQAIYDVLREEHLKMPNTEQEWEDVAEDFLKLWNYPNCLGAMDGRHIAFRAPRSDGSIYYNYKVYNSIILLALVDANYRFIYIDVGTNGRVSDGGVFRESALLEAINSNKLKIPPPRPLPGRKLPVPFVIVADDAFPLSDNVMKPYPNRGLQLQQRIHNYRLSRARRISENVFGMFANRFRVFLSPINLSSEKVEVITLAACALHNFLRTSVMSEYTPTGSLDRDEDGVLFQGTWRSETTGLRQLCRQSSGNRVPRTPIAIREEFKEYFNQEGAVAWQDHYIYNT